MKKLLRENVWRSLVFPLFLLTIASPLTAGDTPAPGDVQTRIAALQERLDALQREAADIQRALDELRGTTPQAAGPAPEEDLTSVQPVVAAAENVPATPPPAEEQAPTPGEPLESTALVQNRVDPATSKIFNPDIAVIGNFIARAGDRNPVEDRPTAALEEAEISFQAFVDPYAKASFFVGITDDGAELEEGFIDFIHLPADLTARVGKMRAAFGKVNTMHTHMRPWVDQPMVLTNMFGDEGLADSGVSVSKLIPNRFGIFAEATGQLLSGRVEGVFDPVSTNDLLYLGHLKLFRDLGENSNLELGGSLARGTAPETGGATRFAGLDLTYRWKPLQRAIYRSFVGRTEIIGNDRDEALDRTWGFYSSADYQFARRWFGGVRIDRSDRTDAPSLADRAASLTLTFWPSEFSEIRGQLRRSKYGEEIEANELLLQFNFSIGAHGAHTF